MGYSRVGMDEIMVDTEKWDRIGMGCMGEEWKRAEWDRKVQ